MRGTRRVMLYSGTRRSFQGCPLSKKKKRTSKQAKTVARPQPTAAQPSSNRGLFAWLVPLLLMSVVAVVLLARRMHEPSTSSLPTSTTPPIPGAKFVGAAECATCHKQEESSGRGSHHQQAMQPADASTVLGDFNRASFDNNGVTSSFLRMDELHGTHRRPRWRAADYAIKFTFGVYPLQQYLIAMPGGRLQALGIAWDTRARASGGQRWFFLYPGREDHGA